MNPIEWRTKALRPLRKLPVSVGLELRRAVTAELADLAQAQTCHAWQTGRSAGRLARATALVMPGALSSAIEVAAAAT